MTVADVEKIAVVPFSLRDTPSLIEKAWPTAKISAETQKERKANLGQTLTFLGSYWKGRKPLILTRACILGVLLPVSDDLEKDMAIFEKLMGMADETFGRRYIDGPTAFAKLFPNHALEITEQSGRACVWRDDLTPKERQQRIAHVFADIPYSERLVSVKRPEEFSERELLEGIWSEINDHLGTHAQSIAELTEQLGIMRFGRRPQVGDTFSGSGSIPFEAARIGCDVFASDLNPIACMLTWGSFEILGSESKKVSSIADALGDTLASTEREIDKLKIERDSLGNKAKAYLYCLETRCPRTGWMVPMAPSWVISKKRNVIARLIPNYKKLRYSIEIITGVTASEMEVAEKGTVRSGRLYHEILDEPLGVAIKEIRGDYKDSNGNKKNLLRPWGKKDFRPHAEDIWQERLYAIQWMDAGDVNNAKARPRTWFAAPTKEDLSREEFVADLVEKNLEDWQNKGILPDMEIQPGVETTRLIRERGWTHWHHLFNPRHLLINSILRSNFSAEHKAVMTTLFCRVLNVQSKLSRWSSAAAHELALDVFYSQALNTFFNYGCRASFSAFRDFENFKFPRSASIKNRFLIDSINAKDVDFSADIWVTDPPYADAVQYDEITEFFIAWLRKNPPAPFDKWIWDSRRSLAIKGEGQSFKASMVDAYSAMAEHMSSNGLQIVQFTHQDAKTWSDMAQIFWGAGLQVVQDWYVSTETMTELKKGGYVQGTHMIVLRKRHGELSGYADEIVHEIRDEVERQIREMTGLNDKMEERRDENIFNDADLQMAGYAAALRVLTAYTKIDGTDMTREALRPRKKGEKTIVDELTEFAVQTANEFLVPDGLDREIWLELNGAERFYLKMMDIEEAGEAKLDQFQNFAKAFRVGDYDDMMASKSPNNACLKTAVQLGKTAMAEGTPFGRDSIVRLTLRAVWRVGKEDEVEDVLEELRDLIPDYLRKRDMLTQIVAYIAAKREENNPDEASAARILELGIRTERI